MKEKEFELICILYPFAPLKPIKETIPSETE